jgi:ATP-dependent exoDNAse (exonuclease V) beta subunit
MGPDWRLGEPEPAYRLLKRLANGRKVGEAKRLLYVGITRARKELFLSGLATNTKRSLKAPKHSPLAWILTHTTNHDSELISTFFNPAGPRVAHEQGKEIQPLPDPIPFEAQPVPYLIEAPSELADNSLYAEDAARGETELAEHAAMRGTITHRLIEAVWHTGKLPETESIATALAAEGMNPDTATAVAQEIADEVTACRKEPFFQ